MEEFNGLKEKIGYDHVDGFCTYLSKLYQSSATHTIAKDRWKVTTLSIYKSRDSVQHEYLVAEVICAQMIIYLRMERKLHMSGVGQMFKNGSTSQPPNPTAKTQTSDDSDSSPDNAAYRDTTRQIPTHSLSKIASDEISYAKTLLELGTSEHKKLCEVIRFPEGEELSLPQLAVLARCVNSMGRTYHLFEENCYWFTHLMIETAKKIKPNHVEEKLSKKKQGSWNGIVVTKKSTPELIDQAKTLYEEEWAAFLRDVSRVYLKFYVCLMPMFSDL
ncbi:hypothetical protein M378DRAFT_77316 [Amanita muscaria Koide BX008]|uniref:Uncharacterized protein n=1 Tax=Amanita muscaria (strain Koide BX008) TaxID=946122 RepID=A0A0C2X7D4_AMAMK|nr:hypothetical protein M378DRAFT_77316 [Amanita muscaria Koide BX008]